MDNFIFDFDGTIADTTSLILEIGNEMLEELGREPVTASEFQELRGLTIPQIVRRLKLSVAQLPQLAIRGRQKLHARLPELTPCEGMPGLLRELQKRGRTIGIVTSNSPANVQHFLERYELSSVFTFVHAGASLFGKGGRLKQAIRKHKLDKSSTLYIGDEVRDIETARGAGISVASVTWGVNSRTLLQAHGPDLVIDKPAQLLDS